MRDLELRRRAVAVLDGNWERGHTVPSRRLYPHQWSWDSAFIAIGWAHASPGRGRRELESLLAAQWADGRVPQIVFNPAVARDAYFPGPDFWRSRDVPGTPGRETSGIVQPPVHAVAALEVHRAAPTLGRRFLRRAYPHLAAQHDYLLRERSGPHGLVAIVHPWESGQDNSPAWDAELARVPADVAVLAAHRRRDLDHVDATERPTAADYARYVEIASTYRDHDYRDEPAAHLFVAVDPLFNALLAWSEEALAEIAEILGEPSEPHRERASALRDALLARCYDPAAGHFFALDHDGTHVAEHCIGGLAPLVLDLPTDVVDALVAGITGPRFALNDRVPLPSYDLTGAAFDATRYWRGPAWINTSWLVLRGLERHGRHAEAATLRAAMLNAVRQEGFREYFDPRTGAGRGVSDFSWSAALTLDLLATAPGRRSSPGR
ncbi:MGH1-like glycoside hydrolase domain-containing protein [Pseudonocardia adelaidensis]|uniref:Trehalase family glycosidase n=1 Tax=Pseudonocardia adelaidensis TaxID=648754 RepID=A0ABP9NJ21_9PSEU